MLEKRVGKRFYSFPVSKIDFIETNNDYEITIGFKKVILTLDKSQGMAILFRDGGKRIRIS